MLSVIFYFEFDTPTYHLMDQDPKPFSICCYSDPF